MSKRVVLTFLALACLAALPGAPAAEDGPARTAVVAIDFDPPCLNPLIVACSHPLTESTAGVALAGAFRARPDLTFEPVLVDGVDVARDPFTLTYRIKSDATWSDGTPVGADDFLFTLETILNPENTIARRTGYDLVTEATKLGPKTVRLRFSRSYVPWRALFPHVLPKHVLGGHDFDLVWREEVADPVTHTPIGSGPFLVGAWTRGTSLTLVRNPRWWGPRGPILDSIVVRFMPDPNSQFNAIRAGEVDVITPQPQFQIADLRGTPGIAVQSTAGPTLEHLDVNVGSATMPLLRERWFRQALAHALDRDALAELLWGATAPGFPAQHNLSFTSSQPEYVASFAGYDYDPAAAAAIMGDHGCVRGEDGIWSCGGVRASIKVATTTGNAIRAQMQQAMQEQARAAGIELVPDNSTAAVLFGVRLPARNYELVLFAWLLSEDFGPLQKYGCGAPSNFMGYCSAAVTELVQRAETEVDPVLRAQLVNEADALIAEDVPTLPLFVRPVFLAKRTPLSGPTVSAAQLGVWNVEEWYTGAADATAPALAATRSPQPNADGWNDGPVTIDLSADDGTGSGVHELRYTLSGAETGGAVVPGSSARVTVGAEGVTTLTFRGRDRFGNAAEQTLTIRIDRTPPQVACDLAPDSLWPPNRKLVPVEASVGVEDTLSGPAGFRLVSVTGGGAGDVVGFELGTPDLAGSVRAERDGAAERRYTLAYEGSDEAGNVSRCTAVVAVRRS